MKKWISIILAVMILLSAFNFCMAEGNDAWKENVGTINLDAMTVSGEGISVDGKVVMITKGGDFEVTGTIAEGMIKVNAEEKVKLRLSGASITNSDGPAIYFDNTEKGFITITEGTENYLCDAAVYSDEEADAVLFSNDDLEIKGDGRLVIDGNYKHGIASDDDLAIENGEIIVTSYEHGIKVNSTLKILGGAISIDAETGKGMKAEEALEISDGVINIKTTDEGIESKGNLDISGGDITIIAGEDGINAGSSTTSEENRDVSEMNMGTPPERPEGMSDFVPKERPEGMSDFVPKERPEDMPEFEPGEHPEGEMQKGRPGRGMNFDGKNPPEMPEGGMPQMPGGFMGGFGRIDEATAAEHTITISGGSIYINAAGDGIDSNGNLYITGGKITIDGPESGDNGPLDSDGIMSITGGEISILSSAGMIQLPRDEEHRVIRFNFDKTGAAGDVVEIKDADGSVVATHQAVKAYRCLIYTDDSLKQDAEYSVYINGEKQENAGTAMGGPGGFMGGGRGNRENRNKINVTMNGAPVSFDTDPIIKNDTTLVGFRAIFEALGAEVLWDEEERKVTAVKDGVTIELTIGSDKAYVGGMEKTLLTAPEIIGNSTLVPVRFVSEELGMDVNWDANIRHISITSK